MLQGIELVGVLCTQEWELYAKELIIEVAMFVHRWYEQIGSVYYLVLIGMKQNKRLFSSLSKNKKVDT